MIVIVDISGNFTGAYYNELTDSILRHHVKNGELLYQTDSIPVKILEPPDLTAAIFYTAEKRIDLFIDETARSKNYDSRVTCTMRAGYENPWQAEGVAFGSWMDSCYTKLHEIKNSVLSGERPLPSFEDVLGELPEMIWP